MEKYSSYKDSGVKWLGEVPSHWELRHLRNFLTVFSEKGYGDSQLLSVTRERGVILRDKENKEENHNFVPDDLSGYKHLNAGDFVINKMKSWQGSYGVSEYDGIVSPAYFTCKLKGVSPQFFSRAIRSKAYIGFFMQYSKGIRVDQWDLDPNSMKDIPFVLPPLSEQNAIASYLDSVTTQIDTAIAQQKKMIELLNERKQIIINNAVTKGLDPNVKMKDSGVDWIGEIPEGWEVKKLKHVCQAFGRIGFRGYSTTDLVDEGDGCITLSPSNMRDGHMQYDKCTYLSWEKYEESPEIKIFDGDILFVKTGSTYGKSSFVQDLPQEATINPQLLVFKEVRCFNEFLAYILQSNFIKNQVEVSVIGGTIPTISQTKILNYVFPYPSIKEQKSIVLYIKEKSAPVNEAIKNAERQISLLQERKQIIINEVVTGKVKVTK